MININPLKNSRLLRVFLSIVDDDIAKTFRDFGHGRYPEYLPLLAQIARNLRALIVDLVANPNIQVSRSD